MSYETYTYEFLLARALSRVPNTVDKRQGSIIYDALAPTCYELAQAYLELSAFDTLAYADTATGEYLTRRAAERGINRLAAVKAVRKGEFNITIPLGSRFSIQGVNYVIDELISGTDYRLECEEAGTIGNGPSGTLLPIDYISGLTSAVLSDVIVPGSEEESDTSLRGRYFDDLEKAAYGGNITDYLNRTNALDGVGSTKVIPVWNGGGTVKLIFTDSSYNEPSTLLVDDIQTAIDPVVNGGMGYGIAPIGHVVTVEGADSVPCDITFTLTYGSGYSWAILGSTITAAISSYLLGLREQWADEIYTVVRISSIESAVLTTSGILDITGTTINGATSNLSLLLNQIPTLGSVIDV